MERHRCKVCFRNFGNGRALGGHMRSHVINLSTPKNAPNKQVQDHDQDQEIDKLHSCSSSSSQGEVENREHSVVLQDCESESTESSKNSSIHGRKRSKRARKQRVFCSRKFSKLGETEERSSPLSSLASDTTTEEDVAHCLLMMSRDRWERENENDDDDDDEDSRSNVARVKIRARVGGKYRCETCNKLFKSYQALGGHRASYKKVKADVAARHGGGGGPAEEKVHQCPFCHRVFATGQALGGHKRSHFMGASNFSTKKICKNW